MFKKIKYIHNRRKNLMQNMDFNNNFEEWEETCVPSYCHSNLIAAFVSWQRIFSALKIAQKQPVLEKVLDFGCGVAELKRLLPAETVYCYVEELPSSVQWIQTQYPDAIEVAIDDNDRTYDVVFALDSLEHNKNYSEIVDKLIAKLNKGGILIVSGPTENILYRLGRYISGFTGHYHVTTIHDINRVIDSRLQLKARSTEPYGLPLFIVSAWAKEC